MGILKDYQEQKKKKPSMETSMGSHSKKKKLPALETCMGSHSKEKKSKKSIAEALKKLEHEYDGSGADDAPFYEHHEHMHHKVAPMKKDISETEKEALSDYTDDSRGLNGALHHQYNGKNFQSSYKHHVDTLTGLLNRHKTKEDSVVYTGLPKSPTQHFEDHTKDAHVHLPAFTSTSSSLHVAAGFAQAAHHANDKKHGIEHDSGGMDDGEARHVLRLHLPKGTSAASVKKHTFAPDEHEILVNRGHDIKIHPVPQVHTNKNGKKYHIWDAHITDHAPGKFEADAD
jgi:hypothetical protein